MNKPVAQSLHLDHRKLPALVFNGICSRSNRQLDRETREREAWNNFGKAGRDPYRLEGLLAMFATQSGWVPYLKIAQLRNHWNQVVGDGIAQHSTVTSFQEHVLTIRADSPAWVVQLTYLIPQLTETIKERLDGLDIERIRVTGPRAHGSAGRYCRRGRCN